MNISPRAFFSVVNSVLLAGSAFLACSCGIITAGVSLPEAFTHNGDLGLRGQLVDDRGTPVDEVIVEVTRDYYLWHADASYTETTHLTYAADHEFNITPMRGERLAFKFKKVGYLDADIAVDKDGIEQSCGCDGVGGARWPLNTPVRMVMPRATASFPALTRVSVPVDYTDPTANPIIDLGLATGEVSKSNYSIGAVRTLKAGENMPPLAISAEIERQSLKTVGKDRQVDPLDINLPANFTLHVGDPAGGFVEFAPLPGSHPFSQMPEAPEDGYQSGLQLSGPRLRLMRDPKIKGLGEKNVFFYFKTDGKYGKGMIRWDADSQEKLMLRIMLMMQPDGTRNVSSVGFESKAERAR